MLDSTIESKSSGCQRPIKILSDITCRENFQYTNKEEGVTKPMLKDMSCIERMENSVNDSHSLEKQLLVGSTFVSEEKKPTENAPVFVNQAEIAWHERRKEWTGDLSQKTQRVPKDHVLSWSLTYDDLLLTNDPFPQPVPLPEMVDFLVDIWHEEGLFD